MATFRLPEDLENRLDTAARARNWSKSEYVREALVKYMDEADEEKSSWELGERYFGKYGSGDGNLSRDYKSLLREKMGAKFHTH